MRHGRGSRKRLARSNSPASIRKFLPWRDLDQAASKCAPARRIRAGWPGPVSQGAKMSATVDTTSPAHVRHNVWQQSRPSPIADLIGRHRAELARFWQRHAEELARKDRIA